MTKNKFMKHIEMAHEKLDRTYIYSGCCYALEHHNIVYSLFSDMLHPTNLYGIECRGLDKNIVFWLGGFTRKNLPLRHHFIDMFAGIILADKGYRDLYKYYFNNGWLK